MVKDQNDSLLGRKSPAEAVFLNMIESFTTPEYLHALTTAIGYGFKVVLTMLVAGTLFTLIGGGWSAMWSKPKAAVEHH